MSIDRPMSREYDEALTQWLADLLFAELTRARILEPTIDRETSAASPTPDAETDERREDHQ